MSALEAHFNAHYTGKGTYIPQYHVSSFTLPKLPVITSEAIDEIQLLTWGLVPFWVKTQQHVEEIRVKTMNARAESIFEKPSFRHAAQQNHCLVLVDGFYEWREFQGRKYPYYIRLKQKKPFALAGLWEEWSNKETEESLQTFTVLTTTANPLMETIHNTKKRMPVMLAHEDEKDWIQKPFTQDHMQQLLQPYDEQEMEAYSISKFITAKGRNTNSPEVMQPYSYPELEGGNRRQSSLF